MSAKTILAPTIWIASAGAMYVNGVVMISSPGTEVEGAQRERQGVGTGIDADGERDA